MGYNDLAANQIVSGTNLQNAVNEGILIQKAQITRGSQEVTKDFADTTVYVNPTNSYYSTSGSNQLLAKRAITPSGSQKIIIGSADTTQFGSTQSLQYTSNGGSSWTRNDNLSAFVWQNLEAAPNGIGFIASAGGNATYGNIAGTTATYILPGNNDFLSAVALSDNFTTAGAGGQYLYMMSGAQNLYYQTLAGRFYRSLDGGGTWEVTFQGNDSTYSPAMGCSGNGAIVCIFNHANDTYVAAGTLIYSGSYGATGSWESSQPSFLNSTTAQYCSISHTGQYILVVTGDTWNNNYRICVNNNYGAYNAWTVTAISYVPSHCSISGDGRCMAVSAYNSGTVYTSTNYGVTWSTSQPRGGGVLSAGVATSFDGNLFAALGGLGDGGMTFATSSNGTSWGYGTDPAAYVPHYQSTQWSIIAM